MSGNGGSQSGLQVVYNVDRVLDCHTHLTGMEGESAESILECLDAVGVEKAFVFAPMLDIQNRVITSDSMDDIRTHNDYCADICSKAPERLLGFCTLNPTPHLTDGDLEKAVDLNIEEAHRCYDELGLRGAGELVPTHWHASEPPLARLWQALADLGMYTVFHAGIFYDGRNSTYCRPAFFEGVRAASGFKGHLAHVGYPWYDECIAMMKVTSGLFGQDPSAWDLKVDVSFGPAADYQLEVWQRSIDTLPPAMIMYGTDTFWPMEPEMYREEYLQPQLGLFETAATLGHIVGEGSPKREEYRNMIFFENAYRHWQAALKEPQNPRPAPEPIEVPNAHKGHSHG
ncbi:MAG: amidohydrolase family protein [Actinomycetota bacterium]|nr:amidohydrolase family protein [Actinomycetota bacterium]